MSYTMMGYLEIGQSIRETYEVERFLGEGAFAEVYRVKHRFLGRQAMKVFRAADMTVGELESLLGEALLLSRIGHPNIIRVFDANTIDTPQGTRGFFTMEYVAGGSLHDFWASHDRRFVPVDTTVEIVLQICRGLNVAHNESPPLIHRDIKPQNILVGYDATGIRIRISDFGLARKVNPLTLLASARGTPCFKAPEAFSDHLADSCAGDIWSVGVLFYLLLTDQMPFSTDTEGRPEQSSFDRPPVLASQINLAVPESLDTIVLRTLEVEPQKRIQGAGELLTQLEKWRGDPAQQAKLKCRLASIKPAERELSSEISTRRADDPVDILKALSLSRQPGKLMEAADMLEEALNRMSHLRPRYESQLRLWRRGVVM